jgi:HD domain.
MMSLKEKLSDEIKMLFKTINDDISKKNDLSFENKIREAFKAVKNSLTIYDFLENDLKNLKEITENYDLFKIIYLKFSSISEMEYYLRHVDKKLIKFTETAIFPEYDKNDTGHDLEHILEVIRRTFELIENLSLDVNHNIAYVIAANHDNGKYIDSDNHELIAAKRFIENVNFKEFFDDETRTVIKDAIEDHRHSAKDKPRSIYGRLISSADRNTKVEVVFKRSFAVGKYRQPETKYVDFLDYTFKRLNKRYSLEDPENMFFKDETYKQFLEDMRILLKDEEEFNKRYSEVNNLNITDYDKLLSELNRSFVKNR